MATYAPTHVYNRIAPAIGIDPVFSSYQAASGRDKVCALFFFLFLSVLSQSRDGRLEKVRTNSYKI